MADKAESATKKPAEAEGLAIIAQKLSEKADKFKYAFIGAAALVIVLVVVFSYQRRASASREAQAENSLFQTMVDLGAAPEGNAVPAFDKLAKEYAGLPTGARALVIKFAYSFNTREFATAESALRDFIKGYPRHPLIPRARMALAQTMVMADKLPEAVAILRELAYSADVEIVPEAKLALAQALEREAEAAKDEPEEYRRRLEAAAAEYNDIVVRSRVTIGSQRGFWPPTIVVPADFALVAIKDRLAGHRHAAPAAAPAGGTVVIEDQPPPAESQPVMATPPPADETPETAEEGKAE